MTGIPKGGKEISVKTLLLIRLYRKNKCNGLIDFAVLAKNTDFNDIDGDSAGRKRKSGEFTAETVKKLVGGLSSVSRYFDRLDITSNPLTTYSRPFSFADESHR